MDANLVVTYDPTHATRARAEVEELLGDSSPKFMESEFEGVFLLRVNGDAKKIVSKLTQTCQEEPYKFKYTHKWVPVEKWCPTNMQDMGRLVGEMNEKIGMTESWKMELGKRGHDFDTVDLIMKLTEHVSRPKVDLKNPQKIIKVEIIGDRTGVSLLGRDEYLNVTKQKLD